MQKYKFKWFSYVSQNMHKIHQRRAVEDEPDCTFFSVKCNSRQTKASCQRVDTVPNRLITAQGLIKGFMTIYQIWANSISWLQTSHIK